MLALSPGVLYYPQRPFLTQGQVMAAAAPTTKAYIVQRINWNYNDEYFYRGAGEGDDQPVKAFRDRARAEAHLRKLVDDECADWDGVNPFEMGQSLADVTSMSGTELANAVRAVGLRPPDANSEINELYTWYEWYSGPGEESEAVWRLLDRIRFFEIIEIAVES